MRIIAYITLILYTLLLVSMGVALLAMAFHLISLDQLTTLMYYFNNMKNLKVVFGSIGAILIVITLISVNLILAKMQREKTIAFTNAYGQVSISLTAIEDLIKKLIAEIPQVKEVRPDVKAGKKGISVFCRTVLWSGVHIPEVTEKIQYNVKNQLQSLLGIEEEIRVKIHIVKIKKKEILRDKGVKGKKGGIESYDGNTIGPYTI